MQDLALKREQHAAALSYLDSGTLALADILAALDDEPAEETPPNATRKSRFRHLARWAIGGVTLAIAATVGALIFAPAASASSPFNDPAFTAVHSANDWQCSPEGALAQSCISPDGTIRGEVTASEGPCGFTFEATFTRNGKTIHTEITSIHVYDDAAISLRAVMRNSPNAFPNMREGDGWLLWSTDEASADHVAADLRAHPPENN